MKQEDIEIQSQIEDLIEHIGYLSKIIYEYFSVYDELIDIKPTEETKKPKCRGIRRDLIKVDESLYKVVDRYIVNSKLIDYQKWLDLSEDTN